MIVSEVASFVAFGSGQCLRCSKQINKYRDPFDDLGNGLANSIENTSKRLVNGPRRLVYYLGSAFKHWHGSKELTSEEISV